MLSLIALLALPLLTSAGVSHRRHDHRADHSHSHDVAKRLPGNWYHRDDHPVHALFKRGGSTDGMTYAAVGSDAWTNAYPDGPPNSPDPTKMPSEWLDALNAAVASKAIPDIPPSTNNAQDVPTYASGFDPNGPAVCSATYGCRIPGDIWDAPAGHVGISFDDGPLPPTDGLISFLDAQSPPQLVTHFMIGSNIIEQPQQFTAAFNRGDDIAVHTWTHPYMTTLTNEQVVAEIGWTIEVIHNSTGGRVPKFWRPPYGDSDVRTSAIAKAVFGLTTIIWNQDTSDWSLTDSPPGTTADKINASMTQWLTGPKSPGLIILEHELSDQSVAAFKAAYPVMKQNGWTTTSLATLMGNGTAYWNSLGDNSTVALVNNILDAKDASAPANAGPSSAGSSPSGSGSGSAPTKSNGATTPTSNPSSPSSPSPSSPSEGAAASTGASTLVLSLAMVLGMTLWS